MDSTIYLMVLVENETICEIILKKQTKLNITVSLNIVNQQHIEGWTPVGKDYFLQKEMLKNST